MASSAAKDMSRTKSATLEVKSLGLITAQRRSFLVAQVTLRILAVAFSVASISVMVTSDQNVLVFGTKTTARYSYSSAFKFLVGADAVVCGFSILSLILVCLLCRSATPIKSYFYIFLHDMVMMVLLASGGAAATAIGYVGRYGEEEINWSAVCDYVGKFCSRVLVSVILSYLSLFCYISLTTLSARKLMSPPNH